MSRLSDTHAQRGLGPRWPPPPAPGPDRAWVDAYLHRVTEEMSREVTRFTECQVLTLRDKIYRCIFFGSGPCHAGTAPQLVAHHLRSLGLKFASVGPIDFPVKPGLESAPAEMDGGRRDAQPDTKKHHPLSHQCDSHSSAPSREPRGTDFSQVRPQNRISIPRDVRYCLQRNPPVSSVRFLL